MPAYFGNRRGLRSGAAGGGEVAPEEDTFLTIFGSDLLVWYDASDAASITHVAGAVSQWNDKSGNGDHLVQATAAKKPTYSATGIGGVQPSLSFDGGDVLTTAANAVATGGVSDFACFVVGQMSDDFNGNGRFASFSEAASPDWNVADSAILIFRSGIDEAVGAFRNSAAKGIKAVTYDTTFRAASVWSGGNHTMYVENVAGTPVADANGALRATGSFWVGNYFSDDGPLTGHVCEVALVKAAPSAGQLTSVQTMLAAKWTA
jgi:hypothetical protein